MGDVLRTRILMTTPAINYESFLAGALVDAWPRCLRVWSSKGRVNDLPRGIRLPRYIPSFGAILGQHFFDRFPDSYPFLLNRLENGGPLESACAFDLLDFLARRLSEIRAPLPEALRTCSLPLPPRIQTELAGDRIYKDQRLDSVGKLLQFEYNGQQAQPLD